MAQKKIEIGPVAGVPRAIVVQSEDCPVGQGHSANAPAVAVVVALVFVDVITHVKDIVNRVLPGGVAERIEIAKGEIAAGVDGKIDLAHIVVRSGSSLGSADGTGDVRVAHGKLVVVVREGVQATCLDFDGVVDVGARVGLAVSDDFGHCVVGGNFVAHANRSVRWRMHPASSVVDWDGIVEGYKSRHGRVVVDLCGNWRAAGPQDNGVGIRISRRHAMGEVEVRGRVCRPGIVALRQFGNGDSHSRVVEGGRAVVDVGSVGRKRCCCEGSQKEDVKHLDVGTCAKDRTGYSSGKLERKEIEIGKVYMRGSSSRTAQLGPALFSPHRRARSSAHLDIFVFSAAQGMHCGQWEQRQRTCCLPGWVKELPVSRWPRRRRARDSTGEPWRSALAQSPGKASSHVSPRSPHDSRRRATAQTGMQARVPRLICFGSFCLAATRLPVRKERTGAGHGTPIRGEHAVPTLAFRRATQ
jgi:hypothetical protein